MTRTQSPAPVSARAVPWKRVAAFSQRELAQYKAPNVIKLVESLPEGPSGKVRRLKLLEI